MCFLGPTARCESVYYVSALRNIQCLLGKGHEGKHIGIINGQYVDWTNKEAGDSKEENIKLTSHTVIRAWRIWKIQTPKFDERLLLRSMAVSNFWYGPVETVARYEDTGELVPLGGVAGRICLAGEFLLSRERRSGAHGIHVFKTLDKMRKEYRLREIFEEFAIGIVESIPGTKGVEHEEGWRLQAVQIERLWIFTRRGWDDNFIESYFEKRYRCTVDVMSREKAKDFINYYRDEDINEIPT